MWQLNLHRHYLSSLHPTKSLKVFGVSSFLPEFNVHFVSSSLKSLGVSGVSSSLRFTFSSRSAMLLQADRRRLNMTSLPQYKTAVWVLVIVLCEHSFYSVIISERISSFTTFCLKIIANYFEYNLGSYTTCTFYVHLRMLLSIFLPDSVPGIKTYKLYNI